MKPKYTINNFTKDNTYWLRSFLPVELNGRNVLSPAYYAYKKYDDDDITGLDTMGGATGMFNYVFQDISEFGRYSHLVMCSGGQTSGYLHMIPTMQGFIGKDFGEIHKVDFDTGYNSSQGISSCSYPDLAVTKNNHILYTNSTRLGLGYYTKATGGSSTTLIDTGTNFGDIGSDTDDWNKKLFDYQLGDSGEEFDITSVTTTTNTNDTLNFSAGTGTPATDDEFMVFVDDKLDFGVDREEQNQHFYGQDEPQKWKRQIEFFNGSYYIGNGNYLASLSEDVDWESPSASWDNAGKQLPSMTQFQCMSANSDKLLVGGLTTKFSGKLMLWDGWNDNWLSFKETSAVPISIYPYNDGWIVAMSDGAIIYTDGYTLNKVTNIPGTERTGMSYINSFYSMCVFRDRIFVSTQSNNPTIKQRSGVHIYDIEKDIWTFIPLETKYGHPSKNTSTDVLFPTSLDGIGEEAKDWEIFYTENNCVGYISDSYASPTAEVFLKIPLKQAMKINQIGLNVLYNYWKTDNWNNSGDTCNVSVSVGDGKKAFSTYVQVESSSTTSKLIPSSSYRDYVSVGNEIEMVDNYQEDSGEFSFITSIDDIGTSNEAWNISPSLSSDPDGSRTCTLYNVKKCDTKAVDLGDIGRELKFNVPDFHSDTLLIHVRFDGGYEYLDLESINIY